MTETLTPQNQMSIEPKRLSKELDAVTSDALLNLMFNNKDEALAYHKGWVEKLDDKHSKSRTRRIGRRILNTLGVSSVTQKSHQYHVDRIDQISRAYAVESGLDIDAEDVLTPHEPTDDTNPADHDTNAEKIDHRSDELKSGWEAAYSAPDIGALQDWEKGNTEREAFRDADLAARQSGLVLRQLYVEDENFKPARPEELTVEQIDDIESTWQAVNIKQYGRDRYVTRSLTATKWVAISTSLSSARSYD